MSNLLTWLAEERFPVNVNISDHADLNTQTKPSPPTPHLNREALSINPPCFQPQELSEDTLQYAAMILSNHKKK